MNELLENYNSPLTSNIVNVNEVNKLTNNVNDNGGRTEAEVNAIAQKLVEKLGNPGARLFYCKIAWKLPESTIWRRLETAESGKNPAKYFSWLCSRELQ